MFRRQPQVVLLSGRTETQYVTREVHEHRAPTDASVKLLKEFEDAADRRRIETFNLADNSFAGRVVVDRLDFKGETRARAVFDINGHRITVEATQSLWGGDEPTELLTDLRDKMASRIANEILSDLASGILTEWRRRGCGSGRSLSSPTAESGDAQ